MKPATAFVCGAILGIVLACAMGTAVVLGALMTGWPGYPGWGGNAMFAIVAASTFLGTVLGLIAMDAWAK